MKVLVLGGTGAMGKHLVQLLSNQGIETVVTSRNSRNSERNVKYLQGNARDLRFIQVVLQDHWDVIIDFMTYTTTSFKERVDLLLNATSQYVFLSSARVYGNEDNTIVETSPRLLESSQDHEYLKTDEYALTKARQEDILRNSGKNNWTVIRPYITYSENRLQLGVWEKEYWLYRALKGRTIVFSEAINSKKTTLTYGLDVSKGIAAIIGTAQSLGETFHITVNESESKYWHEILEVYLEVLKEVMGTCPKVLLLKPESDTVIYAERKYQVLYDRLFDRTFNNSKITQYVGTDYFTKPEIGLRNCLKIFFENPRFEHIDWRMMGMLDKLAKERTPLSEIPGKKQKVEYLCGRYFLVNFLKKVFAFMLHIPQKCIQKFRIFTVL